MLERGKYTSLEGEPIILRLEFRISLLSNDKKKHLWVPAILRTPPLITKVKGGKQKKRMTEDIW